MSDTANVAQRAYQNYFAGSQATAEWSSDDTASAHGLSGEPRQYPLVEELGELHRHEVNISSDDWPTDHETMMRLLLSETLRSGAASLMVAGLTLSNRFDVVSTTPSASFSPCGPLPRHLGTLATEIGETSRQDLIAGSANANISRAWGTASYWADEPRWDMPEHAAETLESVFRNLRFVEQAHEIFAGQQGIALSTGQDGVRFIVDREAAEFLAGQQEAKAPSSLPIVPLAERTSAAIDELSELARGWDGYDGIPVLSQVAEHAYRFLEVIEEHTWIVPDVVPLSNGGMQLEWFVGAYEVEVAIAPDCATHVFFERKGEDRIREFPISASLDVSQVAHLFRQLRR